MLKWPTLIAMLSLIVLRIVSSATRIFFARFVKPSVDLKNVQNKSTRAEKLNYPKHKLIFVYLL